MEKERNMEIKTLTDKRLIMINPLSDGFYDKVLSGYKALKTYEMVNFLEAVEEIKFRKIPAFWRPIFDPSYVENEIVFQKNLAPAVGYSFYWWKNEVRKMSPVEDKKWEIGTHHQYIAFLVWLLNSLVESCWTIEKAINTIVLDSRAFGRYGHHVYNVETNEWETKSLNKYTGKHEICGVYDLTNTRKFLFIEDRNYYYRSHCYAGPYSDCLYGSLATLNNSPAICEDYENDLAVGWLVLE